MPIAMPCPTCKAKLKGPDQLIGRTLKCPGCGTPVTITADALIHAAPKPPPPEKKTAPPTPPPAAQAAATQKKAAEPPSLFDDTDNVGFLDDPAPAAPPPAPKKEQNNPVAKKAAVPEKKQPPVPPRAAKKPLEGAFPNMELDAPEHHDDKEPADSEAEEVFDAALVDEVEELADAAAVEEEEVWVDPVEDEGGEDAFTVVEEDDDLLEVVAAKVDDLEVVESVDTDVTFRLLQMPRMYVRSQSAMFAMTNAYDLLHAKIKKKIGEAIERPDSTQQLLGLLVSKNVAASKVEVVEGRNKLMMTVRRPPYLINARAEIYDADDEKLGSFDIRPFSAWTGSPMWISDANDKQIIKMEMKLFSGRRYFKNKKGVVLAEWVHELTYEKKMIKFKLAARGNSFYLIFKELLDERPRDKMLILGASLGLDLLQAPTGQRGMRFGGT